MPKFKDLKGRKIWKWYVLQYNSDDHTWTCRCECGKIRNIPSTYLLNNKSKSCVECSIKNGHNKYIGKTFNKWKVLSYLSESVYMCLCTKCKTKHPIKIGHITTGKSRQCYKCGKKAKPNVSHGMSKSRLYTAWQRLPKRNGGVYKNWIDSFEEFMIFAFKTGYTDEKHIVRINKGDILGPENYKWSYTYETSSKKLLTIHGITHSQTEWAKIIGISRAAFSLRAAITSDPKRLLEGKNEGKRRKRSTSKYRRLCGMTLEELSIERKMSISAIIKMLNRG